MFSCFGTRPDWGRPVLPTSPEGGYRVLWQVLDAIGCPRVHSAYAMYQTRRHIRGDHWDVEELIRIFDFVTGYTGWSTHGNTVSTSGLSPDGVALALVPFYIPGDSPTLHAWNRCYDSDTDKFSMLFHQSGPPAWVIRDLRTMTAWNFGTPPPHPYVSVGHSFWTSGPHPFGYPFLNPI